MNPKFPLLAELIAEFLGTFVLILLGTGVVAMVVLFPSATPGEVIHGGFTNITLGWGLVLAELAPDRATPILSRARAIGESRVVCGVHYPSDVLAGYLAASLWVSTLLALDHMRMRRKRAPARARG